MRLFNVLITLVLLLASLTAAATDMKGSKDHPVFPRVEGTEIRGYGQSDFDSAKLRNESLSTIVEIAKYMRSNPEIKLYVVGHTDNEGSYEYNQGLSDRRANSVTTSLQTDHGIDGGRLRAVGVGSVSPIATNDTEEGRALNRRVELVKQ